MPRVLIGGFMHEVHTFVDGVLTLDDLRRNGFVASGDEILSPEIGSGQEIHGARDVALFLHAFIEQPDVAWPVLAELLGSDPKLALDDRSAD